MTPREAMHATDVTPSEATVYEATTPPARMSHSLTVLSALALHTTPAWSVVAKQLTVSPWPVVGHTGLVQLGGGGDGGVCIYMPRAGRSSSHTRAHEQTHGRVGAPTFEPQHGVARLTVVHAE